METIHGADLVLMALPERAEGEFTGGWLMIATPMGKNWHWLRASDYASADEMLVAALDYAKSAGIDHLNVVECQVVEEYMVADDEEMEGEIELDAEC